MISIEGDNIYSNNTFDNRHWSAPLIHDPDELEKYLEGLQIVGKTIKQIKAIGLGYDLHRDDIADKAYHKLDNLPEDRRLSASDYDNIDNEMTFNRAAQIDEPIIILFSDNESFEMDFSCGTEVRASMNCIPADIKAGINSNNFNASILYSPCIERIVTQIEIGRNGSFEEWWPSPYGDEWKKQNEFIGSVTIRLDNGIGLRFEPWIDYGYVVAVDQKNYALLIKFKELRTSLSNWEDYDNQGAC